MSHTKALGMSGHQRPYRGHTDQWITPPWLIERLGEFDLDPCCPPSMPWPTARLMLAYPQHDGLRVPWRGRVWLNPPYGPELVRWLNKLARHGDGTALIFARTETEAFHRYVWDAADAVLFLRGRLHFHHLDGRRADHNSGAPSVLIAYGRDNALWLENAAIAGKFLRLKGG